MSSLGPSIDRELRGEDRYFAAEGAAAELSAFLSAADESCAAIADDLGRGIANVYLVGAGGSMANLQPVKLIFDRLLTLPAEVYSGYDLVGREPAQLGRRSLVFLASNSGEVEDTLAALHFARARGARTVAIVSRADSTLAREADAVVVFHDWDEPVLLAPLLVGLRLAEQGRGDAGLATELRKGLVAAPSAVARAVELEVARAEERAMEFLAATHLYVLGAGVLAGLGYKLAYNIVMENIRIGSSFIDASEFRHGPCEALECMRSDMLVLVGSDWSRAQTLRTLDACRRAGARLLVYDAADYEGLHPLLAPLALYPAVQPFVIFSAALRGITDLAPRCFMGGRGLYWFEAGATQKGESS